ncbi:glycosyltransferase family 4 protein [Patescibacteria group bacterium]|jgi:glycosyltransferase involved in cell wall biosynthesis|nr:glycosyltransferase family 4 protein [Patescibacteria group bacterium]
MVIAMIGQKGLPARSGGIERHVETLATGLVSRGHKVIVFGRAWYVAGSKAPAGIEQVITPGIRTKHLDAITHSFTALWAARQMRPDVVHLHGSGIALLTPAARLMHPRAKVVVTFHSIDRVLSKWGWFARLSFKIGEWMACHVPHRTVTISQVLATYCQKTYGVQTAYVTHPIPTPEVPADVDNYLKPHGLVVDNFYLFVGRLIPDKMAHVLIEAYAKARAERPELFELRPMVIVGGAAWTDAYASWLCSLANRTPGVLMLGQRFGKELAALQAGALAHVFPTASEGLSLSLVEACQLNRLVIATDIDANVEATAGSMLRIRPRDVDSLANALIQAAEMDPTDRARLAEPANRHAMASHDLNDRIDDMERIYLETMGRPTVLTSQIVPQV